MFISMPNNGVSIGQTPKNPKMVKCGRFLKEELIRCDVMNGGTAKSANEICSMA